MIMNYEKIEFCRECKNSGHLGKHCYKGHHTEYVNGCSQCGKLVNYDWWYNQKKCPDFEQREYDDPSGS